MEAPGWWHSSQHLMWGLLCFGGAWDSRFGLRAAFATFYCWGHGSGDVEIERLILAIRVRLAPGPHPWPRAGGSGRAPPPCWARGIDDAVVPEGTRPGFWLSPPPRGVFRPTPNQGFFLRSGVPPTVYTAGSLSWVRPDFPPGGRPAGPNWGWGVPRS